VREDRERGEGGGKRESVKERVWEEREREGERERERESLVCKKNFVSLSNSQLRLTC